MTFAQLKQRIIDTLYLPLWLRSGIAEVAPVLIQPKIEPAPEGTPKWCPFTRSQMVALKPDGTQTGSKVAKNRTTYQRINTETNVVEVIGSSIETAYCMGDRCAVWDAKHSLCGMRNPLLHVEDAVVEAKALYDGTYGTSPTTT